MTAGRLIAPQLGLWGPMPPRTCNPGASRPGPPPQHIRAKMAELRAEFAKRAGLR